MNRTFITIPTPAKARLLMMMWENHEFNMDPKIAELAEQDRIDRFRFVEAGIEDETEMAAIQFIHDMNFRAAIPVPNKERARADKVVNAAIKLANIPVEETISLDATRAMSYGGYVRTTQFEMLLPERKKVLIVNTDAMDYRDELVGKLFPRILCVGAMTVQYSFSFGAASATTSRMGELLYPAVADSITKSTWKKNQPRSVIAMGVFPGFLGNYDEAPKKIAQGFIIPKTVEY